MEHQVIAFVLAGGRGNRLLPLTRARAKPAVSFGGKYRIIDFVLSSLINSGVYSIYVLVQFQSQLQHLRDRWQFGGLLRDQFIIPVPAQTGRDNYLGTEIDAWIRYNLFRGTDVDVYFAYAFIGDALNLQDPGGAVQQAEDSIAGGARVIYRF
jgi:glucose-1-phosphate adenylyltransferase